MEFLADWSLALYQSTGIKLTIFYDAYDRARFIKGLITTVELAVICLALSIALGLVGAWLQGSRLAPVRWLVYAYIQFFRNTPPLAQVYFFYFGLGAVMPQVDNGMGGTKPMFDSFQWAVIALSFHAAAFNVEIFRAGVEAVPRATIEAAESLGYTRLTAFVHVVLPLAFRISLPALNNNLVNLVKTTTLSYAIGVPELLYVCNQIWADELNVPEMMNVLLIVYVSLVAIVVFVMNRWERAMRIPGYTPA